MPCEKEVYTIPVGIILHMATAPMFAPIFKPSVIYNASHQWSLGHSVQPTDNVTFHPTPIVVITMQGPNHPCQIIAIKLNIGIRRFHFQISKRVTITWLCELVPVLAAPVMAASATYPWWRHQMETFSALLAISAGNSPVPGKFPAQRPVTLMFSLIWAWINGWVNNREAGDLRRYRAHYDVTVMLIR